MSVSVHSIKMATVLIWANMDLYKEYKVGIMSHT